VDVIELGDDVFCMTAHGNSMEPVFHDGQKILLDRKASVKDHDLVVVRLDDGRVYCKRYFERGEHAVLESAQHENGPILVKLGEIAEIYKVRGALYY
jgi:phage repressor protein C with HTH and peptisase S24 domain